MKHCKVYRLLFVSALLLWPIQALAGGADPYSPFYVDNGFNILPSSLTAQRMHKRRTHHSGTYTMQEYDEAADREQFNVRAWSEFLQLPETEVRQIVYQGASLDKLAPEVKEYLSAARAQEPLVIKPVKDQQPYNAAIEKLQTALAQTDNAFLRQRYVYLILRLAHYSKQYDEVASLYAHYQAQRQQPNAEISRWIDALQAGALQRSGQRAEAAYRFAQLFTQSQTRKLEAQTNFVIKTDAEWQALLALCQDDAEKALMHYLRSLKSKANSLQELKAIYQLAPDSQWVDEALVRELEFVQFSKGSKPLPNGRWWQAITTVEPGHLIADTRKLQKDPKLAAQAKQRRSAYLNELSGIVSDIRSDKKRSDLFISDFAALYLRLLQDKPIEVAEVVAFQNGYSDKSRVMATKALEYFVYLENLETIEPAAEEQISAYLKQLMPLYSAEEYGPERSSFNNNILDYTYIKLEPLYLQQKADWQPAKTYAAKNRGQVMLDNMLVVELRDFKKLLDEDSSEHNLLLQTMLSTMTETVRDYSLDEAMARKYLAADLPEQALAALEDTPQLSPDKVWRTDYNPFNTTLSGNNRKRGSSTKTLKAVIETLRTLKQQVKANPQDAQAHYLLGTLYYNMSWFGNSPMLLRYYRQTTRWTGGEIDLKRAKTAYQQALQHSNDRNLTAKILYALAKIERVELYTLGVDQKSNDYGFTPKPGSSAASYKALVEQQKKQGLGEYLGKLKGYEDTDYFRQVISQCADYRYFHSR